MHYTYRHLLYLLTLLQTVTQLKCCIALHGFIWWSTSVDIFTVAIQQYKCMIQHVNDDQDSHSIVLFDWSYITWSCQLSLITNSPPARLWCSMSLITISPAARLWCSVLTAREAPISYNQPSYQIWSLYLHPLWRHKWWYKTWQNGVVWGSLFLRHSEILVENRLSHLYLAPQLGVTPLELW